MANFFDTFTNAFTGDPLVQAGIDTRNALTGISNTGIDIAKGAGIAGTNALNEGKTGGLAALTSGYGQGRNDILSMLSPELAALYGGTNAGANALTGGQTDALAALKSGVAGATGGYSPLLDAAIKYGNYGDNAAQMFADANGLNGPEGTARAQAAFQASPGYQYQVGQATDAATRAANIAGGALGGNTLTAVTGLAGNLANQDYGNWLQRTLQQAQLYSPLQANALATYGSGVGNASLTGGTGAANIYTGTGSKLADLYSGAGTAGANIYGGTGTNLANLAVGQGTGSANIYGQTGQSIASLLSALSGQQLNILGRTIDPTAKSYEDAGAGQMLGSQNLWNFAINAAKLGANAAGGGLPGGGGGGGYNPSQFTQSGLFLG